LQGLNLTAEPLRLLGQVVAGQGGLGLFEVVRAAGLSFVFQGLLLLLDLGHSGEAAATP
jgi:hypothetical protein